MLTIINDPAGICGVERFALDPSMTIQANIEKHIPSGFECDLLINGDKVDPLTDPRLDAAPSGESVTVIRRPAGLDPVSVTYASLRGTTEAVTALVPKPDVPSYSAGVTRKDSPNNALTAQSNVARAYQAIPDVYGYRRVWPDLIQPSTVEYIDHIKYVTEWMCISRGKGTITAVQYAETPIDDISGSTYEVFEPVASGGYPELGVATISDVLETFASDEVNGQEMPPPGPMAVVTRTGTATASSGATSFTVAVADGAVLADLKSLVPSGTALVAFSYGAGPSAFSQTCTVQGFTVAAGVCTFTFSSNTWGAALSQSGITFTITPNGTAPVVNGPYTMPVSGSRLRWNTVFLRGLKGSVTIKAEWWRIDSVGTEVAGTRQNRSDTYTADTYDQRFYTTDVTPTGGLGLYRIQFTRTSAVIGDGNADVAKLEEVYTVRYYATKTLPGATIIRITTKATEQATGYSERKFNVRWSRHVRGLSSATLSPSRNFGRAVAHIWCVAGNDISGLDVAAFEAINTEHGEDSAALRFDCSIDDADTSLGDRLKLAADTARCVIWRNGTMWTVRRDQAVPYPELQIDYRNLADGGDSVISYSAHLPASNDGVELEYADEATQAKKAYIRLNITTGAPFVGSSSNPKKIRLLGCVTQSQAENRAQLEARKLIYQRVSVSDEALSDAHQLGPLSLVRWVDPNDFAGDDGMQAGEVLSIAGDVITTSEPIDWQGSTSGRISITDTNGLPSAPVACYPTGQGVRLGSMPAGLYVADSVRQCGSRYTLAVGLSASELESAGLYTVTSIKPSGKGVSLALAAYDARIYEAD
jgi:hypothetical protein